VEQAASARRVAGTSDRLAESRDITINYHAPITINGTDPGMEHRLAAYHRRHIDQMKRDLAEVVYLNNRANFDGAVST
jgi:hypothetical protein